MTARPRKTRPAATRRARPGLTPAGMAAHTRVDVLTDDQHAGPVARHPTTVGTAITAAVPTVLLALVALGVLDLSGEQQAALVAGGASLVTVGAALAGWWTTRSRVTPVARPRDHRGVPLVAVDRLGKDGPHGL